MKLLTATLAVFTLAGICDSCSIPQGYEPKSVSELTKLAPLVLQAEVVATDNLTILRHEYNATLNVLHVYKGKLNKTQLVVGGFRDAAACGTEVYVGEEWIFFLSVNPFRVRIDDISSGVAKNSNATYQEILEGLCCPDTPGLTT